MTNNNIQPLFSLCPVVRVHIVMKDDKKEPSSFCVANPSENQKWFCLAPDDKYITGYKHKSLKNGKLKPNALHIGIKNKFIVIDSDNSETTEILNSFFTYEKIIKTPSFSTSKDPKKNCFHYYIPYTDEFKNIVKMVDDKIMGLDIITDNIIEPIENLEVLNEICTNYNCSIDANILINLFSQLIATIKDQDEEEFSKNDKNNAISKYNKLIAELIPGMEVKQQEKQPEQEQDQKLALLRSKMLNDFNLLKRILNNIPDNKGYEEWLNVMFCIIDLTNADNSMATKDKLFNIFDDWSKGPSSYNYENNKKQFYGCKSRETQGKTIRSLLFLSKENNEEEHKKIVKKYGLSRLEQAEKENDNIKQIYNEIILSHLNIANFIYSRHPDKYKFRKSLNKNEHGTYYFYKQEGNNYIIEASQNIPSQALSFIMDELEAFKDHANEKINNIADELTEKQLTALRAKYSNNTVVFGNIDFSNKIIKLLAEKYETEDKIEDLIDANPFLIPFNNCVYDFKIKKFRNIKKEDYIKTRICYNINDELIQDINLLEKYNFNEIYEFIYSIFEDDEKVNYILDINASKLITGYENAYFHLGLGGNGKGLLDYLVEKAFDVLHYSAPSNFLSARANAEIDTSLTAIPRCTRNIVIKEIIEEQQNKEGIDAEIYKSLSGDKSVMRRTVHSKDMIEIPILFTMDIQSNYNPQVKPDGGVKRRTRLLRYNLEFTEKPTEPHQRKINTSMKDNITTDFARLFMLNIIKHANNLIDYDITNQKLIRKAIKEPKDFELEKEIYFKSNDELQQFLDDNTIKTNNQKDKLKLADLTMSFNNYFNKEGRQKWTSRKIADELTRKRYERVKDSVNMIRGIKWKDDDDDDE